MDDATVQILLQIKEQGQQAFTEASAGLNHVREALTKYREAEAAGLGVDRATNKFGESEYRLANRLGAGLSLAIGAGWPALLGTFAMWRAHRRLATTDLVG